MSYVWWAIRNVSIEAVIAQVSECGVFGSENDQVLSTRDIHVDAA